MDHHLRPDATGGKATLLSPMPSKEMPAVHSCQGFLFDLMEGNHKGNKNTSLLQVIANVFCCQATDQNCACMIRTGGCPSTQSSCWPRSSRSKSAE